MPPTSRLSCKSDRHPNMVLPVGCCDPIPDGKYHPARPPVMQKTWIWVEDRA
ncbi:hypothetical protein P280DRAFT_471031 [Massarina eburnea CBS 473.64]|uniref:Uncharacterized protein n=1 Tax=Massarina eburnea CBS 473.64 TaxID=1395130 RepID=A0A6A6RVI6_9PLEO|nr:hypothetical protein P280DRAFT_471031 [Massarina eburnea CBS 473.64]